jgi:hypothetical protein
MSCINRIWNYITGKQQSFARVQTESIMPYAKSLNFEQTDVGSYVNAEMNITAEQAIDALGIRPTWVDFVSTEEKTIRIYSSRIDVSVETTVQEDTPCRLRARMEITDNTGAAAFRKIRDPDSGFDAQYLRVNGKKTVFSFDLTNKF